MKLLIITCSNREKKVSYSIAMKIFFQMRHMDKNIKVNILELASKKLRGCCGDSLCTENSAKCVYGDADDFNSIVQEMEESDCVLFIIPKYAPYPSKFIQFYERLVSIGWGGYVNQNRKEQFSLYQKPVGVVYFSHYESVSFSTIAPILESFHTIGFSLLSFKNSEQCLIYNLEKDVEAEILGEIKEAVYEKLKLSETKRITES